MTPNPYAPPASQPTLLRDLPKEERKKLILSGQTDAGPLLVFVTKHPVLWALILAVSAIGLVAGFLACIYM